LRHGQGFNEQGHKIRLWGSEAAEIMSKKSEKHYECELCGDIKSSLIGLVCCDKCEEKLREHFKFYENERKKVESGE